MEKCEDLLSVCLKPRQSKELATLCDHFGMKPSQLGRMAIQQFITQHQPILAALQANARGQAVA